MPNRKEPVTQRNVTKPCRNRGGVIILLSNIRTFDSLRNSAYRFYFLSNLGQWASQNMQMVTRSLLIYRLTGSAALLGLMALAMAEDEAINADAINQIADNVNGNMRQAETMLEQVLCAA